MVKLAPTSACHHPDPRRGCPTPWRRASPAGFTKGGRAHRGVSREVVDTPTWMTSVNHLVWAVADAVRGKSPGEFPEFPAGVCQTHADAAPKSWRSPARRRRSRSTRRSPGRLPLFTMAAADCVRLYAWTIQAAPVLEGCRAAIAP
jgi:hypothetical protein